MEHSARKKKKHWGLRMLGVLLLLAILFLLIQAIRLLSTARRLQTAFKAQTCGITARVTMDRQALTADQQKLLRNLSVLAGLDGTEWERLKLQGGYEAGVVQLAVYGGEDTLLTRLYLTQDCQAVDIRAIYDRAYANLTEKVGLLSYVLPQWNLGEYVALQQLERAFGLEVGTFPDFQGGMERLQSGLSLPMLCGVILAADQWDRDARKLIYHITAADSRLEMAREIAEKTGHAGQTDSWQWPEGLELDVVIFLDEPRARMLVTGKMPQVKQLTDWSVELAWGAYDAGSGEISMVDQQVIDSLAELLKLIETLQG